MSQPQAFTILPAASAVQVQQFAAQVDQHYGLPAGVGKPSFTQTYAIPTTSLDGTQVAYPYDAVTQPIIDPTSKVVPQPLPSTWYPAPPPGVIAVSANQVKVTSGQVR